MYFANSSNAFQVLQMVFWQIHQQPRTPLNVFSEEDVSGFMSFTKYQLLGDCQVPVREHVK
jgi:hypothetical protein